MKIDQRLSGEFGSPLPSPRGSLASVIGVALVWSVLTVDGAVVSAGLLLLLALGGLIGSFWPASYIWLAVAALAVLAVCAVFVFIVFPLVVNFTDDDDGSYPGS